MVGMTVLAEHPGVNKSQPTLFCTAHSFINQTTAITLLLEVFFFDTG